MGTCKRNSDGSVRYAKKITLLRRSLAQRKGIGMKDLMIDLETLGTTPNAVIIQFGGVFFDRYTGELFNELKLNIDAESSVNHGFEMDAATVEWWMRQDKAAIENVLAETRYNVMTAIQLIKEFIRPAENIWSHATFDFVILQNHFIKDGTKLNYFAARDIRTLEDLAYGVNRPLKSAGIRHTAIDDCKYQIAYCVKCFNKLKGT